MALAIGYPSPVVVYRKLPIAPLSRVAEERRGRQVGIYCLGCGAVFPQHRAAHRGKPAWGRDHVGSPCSHEGEPFAPADDWWEPAVEVLPEPAVEPAPA